MKKLDCLIKKKFGGVQNTSNSLLSKDRLVVNLDEDTIKLDNVSIKILQKGLNFNINQRTLPRDCIVAAVEDTARSMPETEKVSLRANMLSVLRRWKPSKPNVTKEELQALNNLKKDVNITILPADKGRSVVIMKKKSL